MATGLELNIQLGLGVAQPRRLIDVLPRIPEVLDNTNPLRWLQGVSWEPWPCRALTVDGEEMCVEGTFDVVPSDCEPFLTQPPFRVSDAIRRVTLDTSMDGMESVLLTRFNMIVGAAFAGELLSGAGSGGYSLSNTATAPNGAAFNDPASSPAYGLQVLEQEIAERLQGIVGYIHCSPGILSRFVAECGLRLNERNLWETPAGNIVISDAGYINAPEPTGGIASGEGTDWVYASGPIWFESTVPMLIGVGSETFEGSKVSTPWDRNTFVQYVGGFGIFVFDPCPVTAVLVGFNEAGEAWNS